MRNLFQVNVEEGRHLWAMVYLLHKYFGRDGRDEADELLQRRSGDPDKPRILGAFNQPCDHWLSFFAFTMFTDRDGKYQLAALSRVLAEREPWRELSDAKLLRRYERSRLAPTRAMGELTGGLWRLFSTDQPAVRELRNRGMTLVNHLSPLKRWLTARALDT
jgi:hypothetical protein